MTGCRAKLTFITIMMLLLITACGNQDESEMESNDTINENQSTTPISNFTEDEKQTGDEGNNNRKLYPVSTEEVTITYQGEEFEKSVFSIGGEIVYVCGVKPDESYFLGCMKKEDNRINEFNIDIPSDMRIFNMYVDTQENCHILWMSVEKIELNHEIHDRITFEKSYIQIVNKDGDIIHTVDVTDFFAKEQARPYNFVVDSAGFYYFENKFEMIKLNPEGSLSQRIQCEGTIEGIGCGRSSMIYCTYYDAYGENWIGRLEGDRIVSCELKLPQAQAKYSYIAAGTDTELFIYNKDSGVYAYDSETDTLEQRIKGNELPAAGQDVSGYGILGDGRLCLMAQSDGNTVFYYIAVGR